MERNIQEREMEECKNYGHQHPLVLLNEDELMSNQSGASAECSRCGDKVSAPCFWCAEVDCGFYLHKVCADAPSELNHPFHEDHPLLLLQPYSSKWWACDFCDKTGKKFGYRCSTCKLDFHINCALFTFNMAESNFKELEHVALQPPLVSSEINVYLKCFGCWKQLERHTHLSLDCGFNLHKKCAELPLKMNHMCHRKHPLVLQFNTGRLPCKLCQQTTRRRAGFVYCCSPCKFAIHVKCAAPAPVIEDKRHPHPFSLLLRQTPFTCDACGMEGNHVGLFDAEHGSYSCSKCNVIFHVTCVLEDKDSYSIVENEDDESLDMSVNSIIEVLEWNDAGEASVVQHFKHIHHLMLSDRVSEYENKCCDGCLLPISASFYYCMQCDFFLHKVCAELPKVMHAWHHSCPSPLLLTSGKFFKCERCYRLSNAFAYECDYCYNYTCLRCVNALTPGARTCLAHKHPLLFYIKYLGKCSGCNGGHREGLFRCKGCDFSLDHKCFSLPITVENKCDKHLLSLTYHDDNTYTESHFCDICEGSRDPNPWFYHCSICNTSAHIDCALGEYPFIQVGSVLEEKYHEHPVTVVKKMYYYPDCNNCGEPCVDLSLECTKSGCNYISHYECPDDNSSS
ncbi:hypothetical protein GQ457_01G034580 [Hibiscus cannabinus]